MDDDDELDPEERMHKEIEVYYHIDNPYLGHCIVLLPFIELFAKSPDTHYSTGHHYRDCSSESSPSLAYSSLRFG